MAMRLLRRQKLLSGILALILLIWLVPFAADYLEDPADPLQHRCGKAGRRDDPLMIARPGHLGKVLKIRLTDDGQFVDRCELTDVLYELNWDSHRDSRPTPRPDAKSLPKFVVFYVHGWKHSASNDDPDLISFKQLVGQLANANTGKKQVLGVYLSWNAKSKVPPFNWFPFDNLTFWSKQRIADRIAQSGVTTKIVSAIGSVMSTGDTAANQFITIGHSFGARILFSATNQSFIYDTQMAHPGYNGGVYKRIKGIANAVILLNPAFEAARYTALAATTRADEHFAEDQLPLLLSISSTGDWATKITFPLSQLLSFFRSAPEITTLGNYTEHQTHSLSAAASSACGSPSSNDLSEKFIMKGLCLVRDDPPRNREHIRHPRNPFLVAQTTSEIVKDHNDIWNSTFSGWLFAYVNELGNQHRPRLLDKGLPEEQAGLSATKPMIAGPSIPAGLDAAATR
jgi:hypothetical protein